jgi:hypothetical protein
MKKNCTNVGPIYRLQIGTRLVFDRKPNRWNYLLTAAPNHQPTKNTAALFFFSLIAGAGILHRLHSYIHIYLIKETSS